MSKAACISGTSVFFGVVLTIVTIILGWIVIPDIIDDKVKEEVRLVNGTDTFGKWQNVQHPIFIKFNIHHVTNKEEVALGGKPKLETRGPYIYEEKRVKNVTEIVSSYDTIKYNQTITYFFRRDMSVGDESDTVNVVNFPYVAFMSGVLAALAPPLDVLASLVAQILAVQCGQAIIREVTVGDLLFHGINSSCYQSALAPLPLPVPVPPSVLNFSLYGQSNDTHDNEYVIFGGSESSGHFGEIVTWDGRKTLNFWERGSHCDLVLGSDGSLFPPGLDKDTIMRIFVSDLCRSIYLRYKQDVKVHGIKGLRFVPPKGMLSDPIENPDNACFCKTGKSAPGMCPKSGVLDVSSCKGAPVFMSTPHFLDGAFKFQNDSGLTPNRQIHETTIDVEPVMAKNEVTGVLLAASKKIQVNLMVPQFGNELYSPQPFEKVYSMVFPLLWAEETVTLTETSAEDLKSKLLKPLRAVDITRWTLIGISAVLVVVGLVVVAVAAAKSAMTV